MRRISVGILMVIAITTGGCGGGGGGSGDSHTPFSGYPPLVGFITHRFYY